MSEGELQRAASEPLAARDRRSGATSAAFAFGLLVVVALYEVELRLGAEAGSGVTFLARLVAGVLVGLFVGAVAAARGRDRARADAAEQRIKDRLARLETALELGRAAAWELDLTTRRFYAHGALANVLLDNAPKDDPAAIFQIVHADDRARVEQAWAAHQAGGPPLDLEHRIEGTEPILWVRAHARRTYNEAGEPIRVGGFIIDVTDRKVAEEKLEEALDAARNADRAKSDFLAVMSHELRTPMNAVLGGVELLRREAPTPRQREQLDLISGAGRGLMVILDDFLDLAKIEAGKLRVCPEPVHLAPFFEQIRLLWAPTATDKGLELSLDLGSGLDCAVMTDPARARQILSNLVSNAIKFTAKGGVRIAARLEQGADGAQALVASVTDTGPGISLEAQSRLFNAFEQADSSVSRRFGGTGLGLAISRRLANVMGGDVMVESAPGRGATFTVTLDAPAAELPAAVEEGAFETAARPMRVLVVDDNATNRTVASALLGAMGHEVDLADGGVPALMKLGETAYDVVLMDVIMPDLEGPEVTRRLRASVGPNRATPVIALTANVGPEQVATCAAAGMDGYVSKPMNVRRLADEMERVVANAPARGSEDGTAAAG